MPRLKIVVIGLIFISVVGYLLISGLQDTVYYYTVGEICSPDYQPDQNGIRLTGTVVADSVRQQADKLAMDFLLSDNDTGKTVRVHYAGVVPDSFKEGRHIVVEGVFRPEPKAFEASALLVKCPSKYEQASDS